MSEDEKYREEFDALTAGLEMPDASELPPVEDDREVRELGDDEIQERVDAVVDNLRVDFVYVTTVAHALEEDYGWTTEGAERIAQIYLERALFRRDLEQGQEEQ